MNDPFLGETVARQVNGGVARGRSIRWVRLAAPTSEALLEEPALGRAGMVVVGLSKLFYSPAEYLLDDLGRFLCLITELRTRTAGFIVTICDVCQSPDALERMEVAGADLALPLPFEVARLQAGAAAAHAHWERET